MTHYIVRTQGKYAGYIYHVSADNRLSAEKILKGSGMLADSEEIVDVCMLHLRRNVEHVMFLVDYKPEYMCPEG